MVSSTHRPYFTPGKDPVPIVREAGWAPGLVWNGGKSRPPPGFDPRQVFLELEEILQFFNLLRTKHFMFFYFIFMVLSSLLFVDATVPTSALVNRPTGRRISTGYLTCWTSLSLGVWRLITCGSSQCLNCLLITRRLLPPSELKSSLEWFPPHSSHIILTGMYFGPILLTTPTSIYDSKNAVSYMRQHIILLSSSRKLLGTPHTPLGRLWRR